MATRDQKEGQVCVGAIAGAFGVKGEVRLKSFCADPMVIADYAPLSTEDGTRVFSVRISRPIKGGLAARLGGVATRDEAEVLKGTRLYAPRNRLPTLPDDEFYHADLIGLTTLDTGGEEVGKVRAVLDHGAGDLIEIHRPGRAPLLIPFTREAVPTIDLNSGRVVIDPPEEIYADEIND